MSELFEKSIRTLELPAVLEMLSAKAVSEAARGKEPAHIMPATDAAGGAAAFGRDGRRQGAAGTVRHPPAFLG